MKKPLQKKLPLSRIIKQHNVSLNDKEIRKCAVEKFVVSIYKRSLRLM